MKQQTSDNDIFKDFKRDLRLKMNNSLSKIRKELDLGIQDLAEYLGITRQSVSAMEKPVKEGHEPLLKGSHFVLICSLVDYYSLENPSIRKNVIKIMFGEDKTEEELDMVGKPLGTLWFEYFPKKQVVEQEIKDESQQYNLSDEDKEKAISQAMQFGEECINNPEKTQNTLVKVDTMKRGPIAKIWDKVLTIKKYINSPILDNATKVLLIGSLFYLVTPIDLLPDTIPIVGLIDDVAAITYAYTSLDNMLKKENKKEKPDNKK